MGKGKSAVIPNGFLKPIRALCLCDHATDLISFFGFLFYHPPSITSLHYIAPVLYQTNQCTLQFIPEEKNTLKWILEDFCVHLHANRLILTHCGCVCSFQLGTEL